MLTAEFSDGGKARAHLFFQKFIYILDVQLRSRTVYRATI